MCNKMVVRANPDEGKKEMSHQGQERASQVVQWYRICLSMREKQESQV